jgi:hypothetical protein
LVVESWELRRPRGVRGAAGAVSEICDLRSEIPYVGWGDDNRDRGGGGAASAR